MRCFVTGGTGHIGSYLVRLLLEQGYQVAALIRPTSDPWRIKDVLNRLQIIPGDLAAMEEAAASVRSFAPEMVFHLGWYGVGSSHRNDPAQVTQNLAGTLKLLQLASESGCQRWICLGSQAEYGLCDGVLTEELPVRPVTLYGATKLSVGLLSQKLCETYNVGFTWLRLLATYGPMDDQQHMIPYVILTLLRGQSPALSPGEQRWDYLYVEDAARAIWQAATMPAAQGVFNLGSGEAATVKSIVERIRDMIDPSLMLDFGAVPYRPDQVMCLQADISRLQQATGWAPQVSLDEGLKRTVEWYRENCGRY
ncbi:MAG: NAD(P)-dependent oxidoreductase [Firmicutes bacterium]|nr:NAD(P)-dependent oxidoreductase [Dethiobacter sp.]MCL4462311.1 NAD(P)-dependent oxidoreductase [Bacillota bacterium]MCL5993927.1 NAD(P)-dependent oxidoreductase [Bacillota bacterium]